MHTPSEMEKLMADHAADERHIVIRLAWFHIAFEGIQPFIDGNGRTGRLLVNLELMLAGLPPIDIKFIDRIAYYDAFDAFRARHDLSAMEKLVTHYVKERLDAYLAMLTGDSGFILFCCFQSQFGELQQFLLEELFVGQAKRVVGNKSR